MGGNSKNASPPFRDKTPPNSSQKSTAACSRQLTILAILAIIYTLYFAQSLLIPFVVALFFALLLSPTIRFLKKRHIPRSISAIVLIGILLTPFTLIGIGLVEPVEKWIKTIPEISKKLGDHLEPIEAALNPKSEQPETQTKRFLFFKIKDEPEKQAGKNTEDPGMVKEKITQGSLEILVNFLTRTPFVIAQIFTCLILIIFFLIFGPRFYQTAIAVMPWITDKKLAHCFFEKTQLELSRYIVTVTLINCGLGVAVGSTLAIIGMEDPLLWGVMVGLLNFAPYVGPLIGTVILGLAGMEQYGLHLQAFLPMLVYFVINFIEFQIITPLTLGQHMKLNPLIVMLWLVVWGWLWGFIGILLAVPLLVCFKVTIDQFNLFPGWVELIETSSSRINKLITSRKTTG